MRPPKVDEKAEAETQEARDLLFEMDAPVTPENVRRAVAAIRMARLHTANGKGC